MVVSVVVELQGFPTACSGFGPAPLTVLQD